MLALIANLIAAGGLVALALVRPGYGIGFALALGRHTFPDRTSDFVIPAAPLLLVAAAIGTVAAGRRIRLEHPSIVAAMTIGIVALVGGLRSYTGLHDFVPDLASDRSLNLVGVVVPLVILAPLLRHANVRKDLFGALILVPLMLTMLGLATGSFGRDGDTAVGGGPITLAQAAGIAILIMVFYNQPIAPKPLARFETPVRVGLCLVLALGMLLTESRQPLMSLIVTIAFAVFFGASKERRSATTPQELRRARRIRLAAGALLAVSIAMFINLVFLSANARFALLANPAAEIQRSRWDFWSAGFEDALTAGPIGHGFGWFSTNDFGEFQIMYPHNIFLELFGEVGPFVGLVASAVLLSGLYLSARRGLRIFTILGAYTLLGAQVSGDLYNSRYVFFFLTAGAIVRASTAERSRTRSEQPLQFVSNQPDVVPIGA